MDCVNGVHFWTPLVMGDITEWEGKRAYFIRVPRYEANIGLRVDNFTILLEGQLIAIRTKVVDSSTLVIGVSTPRGVTYGGESGPSILVEFEQLNQEGTFINHQAGFITSVPGKNNLEEALGDGRAMMVTEINFRKQFLIKFTTP